jgi:hypothetical protein
VWTRRDNKGNHLGKARGEKYLLSLKNIFFDKILIL